MLQMGTPNVVFSHDNQSDDILITQKRILIIKNIDHTKYDKKISNCQEKQMGPSE